MRKLQYFLKSPTCWLFTGRLTMEVIWLKMTTCGHWTVLWSNSFQFQNPQTITGVFPTLGTTKTAEKLTVRIDSSHHDMTVTWSTVTRPTDEQEPSSKLICSATRLRGFIYQLIMSYHLPTEQLFQANRSEHIIMSAGYLSKLSAPFEATRMPQHWSFCVFNHPFGGLKHPKKDIHIKSY